MYKLTPIQKRGCFKLHHHYTGSGYSAVAIMADLLDNSSDATPRKWFELCMCYTSVVFVIAWMVVFNAKYTQYSVGGTNRSQRVGPEDEVVGVSSIDDEH